MNQPELRNNSGFRWFHSGNLHVKGFLFDRQNNFHSDHSLTKYFHDSNTFIDLENKVKYASGCFSVIFQTGDGFLIATDNVRSFPIFYIKAEGKWVVSDDAYFLTDLIRDPGINEMASHEFLATGYVTGKDTLIREVKQVQAGEVISLEREDVRQKFYFTFRTTGILEYEYEEMRTLAVKLTEDAFNRFIDSLKGRTVLVSLSGGYDSRLIAVMLKRYNYPKVVCMTYGRDDNREMELAEKVSERLGFPWLKIVYDQEMIKNYIDDRFIEFYKSSANLTSMFFLQDYFAAKHLKEKMLVPENTIVAIGHSGDFLGGSQLNKHGNIFSEENLRDIAKRIYYIKYNCKRPEYSLKEKMIQRIERSIQEKYTGDHNLAYSIHEDWDFKEKLAKFNFNSANTYTNFGYEFRFPFWDNNLIEFFRDLPLEARMNKFLYNDILMNDYFEPLNLNFENELSVDEKMLQRMKRKDRIKYYLPEEIKRLFIHRNDKIFYREITECLVQDALKDGVKIKTYGNSYNSIIIQWYLLQTKRWLEIKKKI